MWKAISAIHLLMCYFDGSLQTAVSPPWHFIIPCGSDDDIKRNFMMSWHGNSFCITGPCEKKPPFTLPINSWECMGAMHTQNCSYWCPGLVSTELTKYSLYWTSSIKKYYRKYHQKIWDIENSLFDLENSSSRSWPRSNSMVTFEALSSIDMFVSFSW